MPVAQILGTSKTWITPSISMLEKSQVATGRPPFRPGARWMFVRPSTRV